MLNPERKFVKLILIFHMESEYIKDQQQIILVKPHRHRKLRFPIPNL